MRITQNMMQRSALGAMQSHTRQIMLAQQQVSTGLRVQKVSDDPVAASGAMQTGGSLRALEQYRRNIQLGQSRAEAEETALDAASNLLVRAKELALGQGGSPADAASRRVVKEEVDQLIHTLAQLGNTRIGNTYIFGGNQADRPPILWPSQLPGETPGEYPQVDENLDAGYVHRTEISAGQKLMVNSNAQQAFGGPDGPLAALIALSEALGANDEEAIRASIYGIDGAFDRLQSLIGGVGARSNQLQLTASNLAALEINLRVFKADLEEVDLERAITELVGRQTTFEAAMLATSRVMGMTLTDYLR